MRIRNNDYRPAIMQLNGLAGAEDDAPVCPPAPLLSLTVFGFLCGGAFIMWLVDRKR